MKLLNLFLLLFISVFICASCVKERSLYNGEQGTDNPDDNGNPDNKTYYPYLYNYKTEVSGATAEISIELDELIDLDKVEVSIPPLKYNKSWLLLLTQDDCKQAAYCSTWAAINGKPIAFLDTVAATIDLYYNAKHLYYGDLPPNTYEYKKTLGSSDGAGNEVRFAFTTTLYPESEKMDVETNVNNGFTDNYYRFYMQSLLVWDNVKEMLAYGNGIAFHDVAATDVNNESDILSHLSICQSLIKDRLSGRGCKVLAEPNGNKTYLAAGKAYDQIQIMTAQAGATKLYPFQVTDDLHKKIIERWFYNDPNDIKDIVKQQLRLPKEERLAICLGVHGTSLYWTEFLLWLNNMYGKDGDDSLWFPSLEEYYEYNYYRFHATISKKMEGNTLKLTVTLPTGQNMYYPSVTINLKGLSKNKVKNITSTDNVTGFSSADYEEGLMMNLDFRKNLVEHATHFVLKYEETKKVSDQRDARYFVNMLKESAIKTQLLERIGAN